MVFALERLKEDIVMIDNFLKQAGDHFNQELQDKWLSRIKSHTKNVKTFLLRLPGEVKKPQEIRVVVKHYQFQVCSMLNRLYGSSRQKKPGTALLVKPILTELNDLLVHIKQQYPGYFNKGDKLPDMYREEVVVPRFYERIEKMKELFKKADPGLVQVIGECLQPGEGFSYNDLDYAEKLLSGLERLREDCSTDDVVARLVEFNFNCGSFISWMVKRISAGIPEGASIAEKKEYFNKQRKAISQVFGDSCAAFVPANEPVKERICKWIVDEIEILEKEEQNARSLSPAVHPAPSHAELVSASSGGHPEPSPEPFGIVSGSTTHPSHAASTEKEKMWFNVSLEEAALLWRSACDAGLVKVMSKSLLFRIVTKFIRTNNSTNPSAKSMNSKSYEPSRAAVERLIDFLHKMIYYLRKYLK